MSQVYMCDSCNQLFSVNQAGWKQFQESISNTENNAFNHGSRTLHMCPDCVPNTGRNPSGPIVRAAVAEVMLAPKDSVPDGSKEVSSGKCYNCGRIAFLKDEDGDWICDHWSRGYCKGK
jgi:hypothetical protein